VTLQWLATGQTSWGFLDQIQNAISYLKDNSRRPCGGPRARQAGAEAQGSQPGDRRQVTIAARPASVVCARGC